MIHKHLQTGFTLIELVLYVSLMSIFLLSLIVVIKLTLDAKEKNHIIVEVEQQGLHIMNSLSKSILASNTLLVPVFGSAGSTLSLEFPYAEKSPTIYTVSENTLFVQEGNGPQIPLSNEKVLVSDLAFTHIGVAGTRGAIQIRFTLSYIPTVSGRSVFSYSKSYQTSLSIHP